MAVAFDNDGQVTWSSSNSTSISAGGTATSDARTVSATAIDRYCGVKIDNAGTPASGDTAEIRILQNIGDPDADPDSADEFEDADSVTPIVVDTNETDPAIIKIWVPMCKSYKVHITNNSSGRSMTCSANHIEQTA
jgi:hypothetical protein